MSGSLGATEGKKEAIKTFIEQTKLLVTLSSAFLFAPAALVAIMKDTNALGLNQCQLLGFIVVESCFVLSVVAGYIVLGTVTGSQDDGTFNVYRPATRCASLVQLCLYLLGISVFVILAVSLLTLQSAGPAAGA